MKITVKSTRIALLLAVAFVFLGCVGADTRKRLPTLAEVEGPVKPLFVRMAPRMQIADPGREAILGKWVCRKQRNERTAIVGNRNSPMKVTASTVFLEFDLNEDGTCRVRTREESQYEIRGKWTYAGGRLTIPCAEPDGATVNFRVLWYGPEELELRYENLEDFQKSILFFRMKTFDPVCSYDADGCLNFSVKHRFTNKQGKTSLFKYIKIDSPMICRKVPVARSNHVAGSESRKPVAPFGRDRMTGKWEDAYFSDSISFNFKGVGSRNHTTISGTFFLYSDGVVRFVTKVAGKETSGNGTWTYSGDILETKIKNQATDKDEHMAFKVIWYSDSEAELRFADINDYAKLLMRTLAYADAYYDEAGRQVSRMVIGGKDGMPGSFIDIFTSPRRIERTGDLED